jgi:ATP-binding cassette subfamily C protein
MRTLLPKGDLARALAGFRASLVAISAISGVVNVLALTGAFYMLQVYDRVLTSHSVPTLVALSVLAIGLYLFQGTLDVIRGQALVRLGSRLDRRLAPLAHDAVVALPLQGAGTTAALQPLRDIDAMRAFLASQGPVAILDLPWMPAYLAFVFLLHPWLGALALAGTLLLVALTWLTERLTRPLNAAATKAAASRMGLADANARNAEVLRAMGFGGRAAHRFARANDEHLALQAKASDIGGGLGGLSRVARMMLQSALLGLGAYLTIRGEVSAGAIIAAAIAASRALAPVELAIAHWKSFVAARQGAARLKQTLAALPAQAAPLALPAPRRGLAVEGVSLAAPGSQRLILTNISFELAAGQALGVIGPSAAGKSTLARALTGVWPLARGAVRLDGAALERWLPEELGRHIGYLPQDVALFDGTIADNIARFEEPPEAAAIIAAAQAADVHEMILRLPDGYETRLGPGGTALSAGQRQRLALARALYRDPFLVVLDEPNSNLDADGEAALTRAIAGIRTRGGVCVVIAHRPSALAAVDLVAVIGNGQLTAFGPRDEVLRKVLRQPAAAS